MRERERESGNCFKISYGHPVSALAETNRASSCSRRLGFCFALLSSFLGLVLPCLGDDSTQLDFGAGSSSQFHLDVPLASQSAKYFRLWLFSYLILRGPSDIFSNACTRAHTCSLFHQPSNFISSICFVAERTRRNSSTENSHSTLYTLCNLLFSSSTQGLVPVRNPSSNNNNILSFSNP